MANSDMTQEQKDLWHSDLRRSAVRFREKIYAANQTNPWPETFNTLEYAMMYLMTELWDWNFSVTEIDAAFRDAADDVRRYSAGH